jgi:hypothetical protein
MIKCKTALQHKIGEREYSLEMSNDSPLGEIHDALIVMRNFILQKMQEIDAKPEVNCAEQK